MRLLAVISIVFVVFLIAFVGGAVFGRTVDVPRVVCARSDLPASLQVLVEAHESTTFPLPSNH